MRFLFSEPFIKVAGKELEFPISSPVSLRALIGQFPPDLIKIIHHENAVSDIELWAHVMFFNKVRLLRLDDMIDNDEIIKVLLPATGG
ncbi:MAG: hypothetical protein ACOYOS_00510 [Syntrophales bacterium]